MYQIVFDIPLATIINGDFLFSFILQKFLKHHFLFLQHSYLSTHILLHPCHLIYIRMFFLGLFLVITDQLWNVFCINFSWLVVYHLFLLSILFLTFILDNFFFTSLSFLRFEAFYCIVDFFSDLLLFLSYVHTSLYERESRQMHGFMNFKFHLIRLDRYCLFAVLISFEGYQREYIVQLFI